MQSFTSTLRKLIAQHKLLTEDFEDLKKQLNQDPESGDLVPGTGGIRKIRLKSPSKGKSGGFRVCYFYYAINEKIYLILLYPKNEQEDLTATQKQDLKKLTTILKEKNNG